MKISIALEQKEVRTIIAKYLGLEESSVIPSRYSFSVTDIELEELKKKLDKEE